MQKKAVCIMVLLLAWGTVFTGCTGDSGVDEIKDEQLSGVQTGQNRSASVLAAALDAIHCLKDKDMEGLSSIAHPDFGIRFTPYAFIDLQDDLVFTPRQISGLFQDATVYTWGKFDGTGDLIELSFSDYYDRFIYNQDFENPHIIGNNVVLGTGNTINNIAEAYPEGIFVEFHFSGFDSQYAGMDWCSLRLVFQDMEGIWYLVGIVHDEWTI